MAGDVIVIRYEGPKGSPGMPEMLAVTAAVAGAGLGKDVALDHRRAVQRRDQGLLGRAHRARGVRRRARSRWCATGDQIVIDADARRIDLQVEDAELAARRAAWKAPEPRYTSGALAKYAKLVGSADHGAVTG